MSKVENLQTINRAKPFPCVSVALAVLAMFVLSWLAAKGVRNNLQPLLIFAGLCLPIFIAEPRNHHNKWAIIVFDAVPVITYAFGYLVLRRILRTLAGPLPTLRLFIYCAAQPARSALGIIETPLVGPSRSINYEWRLQRNGLLSCPSEPRQ